MLSDLLKDKHCFKLVCGAGNENPVEVERLVALYSVAGANLFDLSANPEILEAAQRGLARSEINTDRYICVSIGLPGDPHVRKAAINNNCLKCKKCILSCPQQAISGVSGDILVDTKCCIGCGKCTSVCQHSAIDFVDKPFDITKLLPELISKYKIDCLELHPNIYGDDYVFDTWKYFNSIFNGLLSVCLDRSKLGNDKLVERIQKMRKINKLTEMIVQADGSPMSGGKDDYKTTLQAVATAEIVSDKIQDCYILVSGGTNSKTSELAKLCNVPVNGVAIGSFARKIVKDYISRDDFFENKAVFDKALYIAKKLVKQTFYYMN